MKIRDDYKDVLIVDERGRVEYFSGPSVELFDLKPEALTGIKVTQLYRNLNEDDSIMVRTLKHGETPVRIVQELDLEGGKVIRQESDTFAIQNGDSVIGAIGFAYYDMEKDVIEKPREAGARRPEENAGLSDITGESEAAREIRRRIAKIADLNTSVFLTGETGTGKELTARIIHNTSNRKKENFVYVNCGTLPENLIESILFGSEKGSFTDSAEKDGLFVTADRGTIFLDDIDAMPIETQSKILRAIEEKKIRPIGSEKEIPVDVRIIASCGMNLDKVMETGALRMDLYFRLSAIQIELPPLRERRKDIPALVRSFIDRFNREFGSNILGIDEETEDFFMRYRWPGNIRELRNTIEGAFFTAREDHIRFRDVSERFLPEDESEGEGSGAQSPERAAYEAFMESGTDLKVFMREYERQAVYQAVNSCGGDLRKAAKSLGISDQMLKYNMKKFGM